MSTSASRAMDFLRTVIKFVSRLKPHDLSEALLGHKARIDTGGRVC